MIQTPSSSPEFSGSASSDTKPLLQTLSTPEFSGSASSLTPPLLQDMKKVQDLRIKLCIINEKINEIKLFKYNNVYYTFSREIIKSFEWLHSFIITTRSSPLLTSEFSDSASSATPIVIDKTNKEYIFNKYKSVISILKYITSLYIYLYKTLSTPLSTSEFSGSASSLTPPRLQKENNLLDKDNLFIFDIITKKYQILLPLILYPEFVFDKFIYHRKSHIFSNDEINQALNIERLFELFYYSLLNRMEEYEFIAKEINTKIKEEVYNIISNNGCVGEEESQTKESVDEANLKKLR